MWCTSSYLEHVQGRVDRKVDAGLCGHSRMLHPRHARECVWRWKTVYDILQLSTDLDGVGRRVGREVCTDLCALFGGCMETISGWGKGIHIGTKLFQPCVRLTWTMVYSLTSLP